MGRSADAPIATGYDGTPLGMIAFQGYAWIMNQAGQNRDDGTTLWPWTVAAPGGGPTLTDLGSSGTPGINDGAGNKFYPVEDNYRVTWVTTVGETNPSTPSLLTPANDGLGHSTQIAQPAGAPACATGWNIYRQVPGYGGTSLDGNTVPYLLNPSPIPISQTTYVDTGNPVDSQDDTSLLLLGTIMADDHDPPPAAAVLANQVYNGRIIAANSAAFPNRLWFTDPLEPAFFPGSADTFDGNWVDIGTDRNDGIVAITVRPGFLTHLPAKIHLGPFGRLRQRERHRGSRRAGVRRGGTPGGLLHLAERLLRLGGWRLRLQQRLGRQADPQARPALARADHREFSTARHGLHVAVRHRPPQRPAVLQLSQCGRDDHRLQHSAPAHTTLVRRLARMARVPRYRHLSVSHRAAPGRPGEQSSDIFSHICVIIGDQDAGPRHSHGRPGRFRRILPGRDRGRWSSPGSGSQRQLSTTCAWALIPVCADEPGLAIRSAGRCDRPRGMVTRNVAPRPTALSTSMLPPCSRTSSSTRARPIPVPS